MISLENGNTKFEPILFERLSVMPGPSSISVSDSINIELQYYSELLDTLHLAAHTLALFPLLMFM